MSARHRLKRAVRRGVLVTRRAHQRDVAQAASVAYAAGEKEATKRFRLLGAHMFNERGVKTFNLSIAVSLHELDAYIGREKMIDLLLQQHFIAMKRLIVEEMLK